MDAAPFVRRRSRTLATELVDALTGRIRTGRLRVGDKLPTEAELMHEFGVSRTVVREAISRLQASGLAATRHGIGTFVMEASEARSALRIAPEQLETLRDVIAMLELRIGVEAEAAALAASRRGEEHLRAMRAAQARMANPATDDDAAAADRQFHLEIARASQNPHYAALMEQLGAMLIPRARLNTAGLAGEGRRPYQQRVHAEHDSILDAIANRDPETARAAMRTHLTNSRERLRRVQHHEDGETQASHTGPAPSGTSPSHNA